MVVIRLARAGAKKKPFYHIVATDSRNKRDGKYLERLGYYNPIAQGQAVRLLLNRERVQYWQGVGAKLSRIMGELVKEWDKTGASQAA